MEHVYALDSLRRHSLEQRLILPANQRPCRALTAAMAAGIDGHFTYTLPCESKRRTHWKLERHQRIQVQMLETDSSQQVRKAYLSGVLVYIYMNNASMFIALFNDIILNLYIPARLVFSDGEKKQTENHNKQTLQHKHIHTLEDRQSVGKTHPCGLNMLESCRQWVARGWVGRFMAWFMLGAEITVTEIIYSWISWVHSINISFSIIV